MFSFEQVDFLYDPFPIGLIKPVMEQNLYDALVDTFPPIELFKYKPKFGTKYTLSEKFSPDNYQKFVATSQPWRDLHDWIKSEAFFRAVDGMLRAHYIDLGLKKAKFANSSVWPWRLREFARGHWPRGQRLLRSRFEFSMLPADGGCVTPHTDTPRKVITLVVPMVKEGEWDPSYGGGTEVNRATSHHHAFNQLNEQVPFDEIETLNTFEFGPNQCVIFVRTFNSLHCVRPMKATGRKAMRRSITINIEKREL